MDIAAVYQLPKEPGIYHLVLRCACEFVIVANQLDDTNPPCPLHEPHRYLGTQPTPAPSVDDDWDEPTNLA
jgi:hypothetical protein